MIIRLIYGAIFAYFALCAGVVVALTTVRAGEGAGPEQPIAFSHKIHAGELGLECTTCHQTTDRSRHAGIPPLEKCMECHEHAATDRPEVQKIMKHWEEQEPVEWVRVHDLPWHVGFSHKRHIKAGVECAHCHGEVAVQSRIRKVRSLKMGWCVSCHESKNASTDCTICHK